MVIPQTPGAKHASPSLAPDQILVVLRIVWCVAMLALLLLPALAWAAIDWTPPSTILFIVRLVVGIGALIIGAELAWAAWRLIHWSQAAARSGSRFLRIRTPNPATTAATMSDNAPDGGDLWYALHRLLPEIQHGLGSWASAVISANPDEPVDFGMAVGGGTAEQRLSWASSLRQLIIGLNAEAFVEVQEEGTDPLTQAMQRDLGTEKVTLAWADYVLRYNPGYPLRMPEDAVSDLLGPLVAQIRPRAGAVRYAELHVTVQGRHDWRMDAFGWRAAAHRRLLQMRQRAIQQAGALPADGKVLEAKMDSPAFSVVLRPVIVAYDRDEAERMLREIDSVLGQYSARSGQLFQRLFRTTTGMIALQDAPIARMTLRNIGGSLVIGGVLGLLLAAITALVWPVGLVPMIALPAALLHGLSLALLLCIGLLPILASVTRWREQHGLLLTHWLTRLRVRAPRFVPPHNFLLPVPAWRWPAVLSAGELGGLWHLPSPNLSSLVRWLPCRAIPAPPHAFINEADPTIKVTTGQRSQRITLGHAVRSDGRLGPVGPSLYDLRNIGHITAGMGGGKTRLFANIIQQILPAGTFVMDNKGDDAGNLVETMKKLIPFRDEWRVVILDMQDTDWPVSMNPLAGISLTTPGAIDRVTAQIQSIFARLDPEGWKSAPGMQQFLDMGTRLVVEGEIFPTVAHVKQALLDQDYRTILLKKCTQIEVKRFWLEIYPTSSEQQKTSMNALMRRFDKLLLSTLVRNLMTQERPTFRFEDAIEEQLIVLCPIPHVRYGALAATASMLMFQSFLRAAFDRPGTAATREDYPFFCDEFQVLVMDGATDDVEKAISQLRALGIPTIYAHQALDQIASIVNTMMINAENRVLIRTQEPDASIYARHYAAAGITGADIANQEPTEHQYARFLVGGQPVGPISMKPLGWPTPLTVEVPPYSGPDWQTIVPQDYPPALPGPGAEHAAGMAHDYDQRLLTLIYHTPYTNDLAMRMAAMSDEQWYLLNSRWEAMARTQRAYILAHPGCIPDHEDRIRWLSRLGYARPRLLAEIEFLRICKVTGFDARVAAVAAERTEKDKKGKGRDKKPPTEYREHWSTSMQERGDADDSVLFDIPTQG